MPDPTATPESNPMDLLRGMIARGAGNTPDAIMLRLLWLRREHPEAKVLTEALHIAADRVVMRATIALPGGATGSGIAAATIKADADWAARVEGAETVAISRALDTLGYVLRAAGEQTLPTEETPAQHRSPRPTPEPASEPQAAPEPEPEPASSRREPETSPLQRPQPARVQETAPTVVNALRRARRPQAPESDAADSAIAQDDAHLEEYSWSSFWSRARDLGMNPNRVTEILGRPANSMTPREAIEGLVAAGAWPDDNDL